MALETLKGVNEIDGFKVIVMDDLKKEKPELFLESGAMDWEWFEKNIRPYYFIYVRHDKNSISHTIQNGPTKEVGGVNGCQLTTLVETALVLLRGVNKKFPCRENAISITKWEEGLMWQKKRTEDREKRGVEGENKA